MPRGHTRGKENFKRPSHAVSTPTTGAGTQHWQVLHTLSSTEGDDSMRTVAQRHSNLPLALCTKRGCRVSSRNAGCCAAWLLLPFAAAAGADVAATAPPGTQPSSAMSWHPLHTPRLKVSGLFRQHMQQLPITLGAAQCRMQKHCRHAQDCAHASMLPCMRRRTRIFHHMGKIRC